VYHVISSSSTCLERKPSIKVASGSEGSESRVVGVSFASGRRGRWSNSVQVAHSNFCLHSRSGLRGQGTALLQRVCRERCNRGFYFITRLRFIAPFVNLLAVIMR
jgi:hypothetical protein